MAKTLENTPIDELVDFIEDKSKHAKKKKVSANKKPTNVDKVEANRLKKERREKLSKYNREKHPLYGKKKAEQQLVREEYNKMLKDEELMKQQKMKEIMEVLNDPEISEEQKKEFFGNLLNSGEIEKNE